ncbi:hypothetical protein H4Q26_015370 [Puccinia striiformis f. sp. tritici PST-130]|nr:hypothetical protein Pst134EB_014077 [Puccinia striiformis f. sp. tritici]KAI9621934.1 hypothetical protein H4Q26_015370 [Puccinia striiformis f. sp. tritici PST-130]
MSTATPAHLNNRFLPHSPWLVTSVPAGLRSDGLVSRLHCHRSLHSHSTHSARQQDPENYNREQEQDREYDDYFHQPNTHQSAQPIQPGIVSNYAIQRDKLTAEWRSIKKTMTAAYFASQYNTKNWTTSTTFLEPLEECVCLNLCKRRVDLIHTHNWYPSKILGFCASISDPV